MYLKNSFTETTYGLFVYADICWVCGMSVNGGETVNAAHHILGRCSNSPLNFCPIHNNHCHLYNADLTHFTIKSTLLRHTLQFLTDIDYCFNDDDRYFMEKHAEYYNV